MTAKSFEIINEYAKKGYRYAGYIPTMIDEMGLLIEMDMIFEKPI